MPYPAVAVYMSPEMRRNAKVQAAMQDISLSEYIRQAVQERLDKDAKKKAKS